MTEQQEKDLQAALVECRRFVSAAKLALAQHVIEENIERGTGKKYRGNKETSATKRASMDLTRALSAFRRRKDRQ